MQNISSINHSIYLESEQNQLKIVDQLLESESDLQILMDWMIDTQEQSENLALGKAYHALYLNPNPKIQEFLQQNFPLGVVPLESTQEIDYRPLQQLLAQQDFQGADVLTLQKMCELAGTAAVERKWIYFTEIVNLQSADLISLERLWIMSYAGK